MDVRLHKSEKEKGVTTVQVLARLCQKYRRKYPKRDFYLWLTEALSERRCFGMYNLYAELVRSELDRIDAEPKKSRKKSQKKSKRPASPPQDLDCFPGDLASLDDGGDPLHRLKGPFWASLSDVDKEGTLRAALARHDELLPDP